MANTLQNTGNQTTSAFIIITPLLNGLCSKFRSIKWTCGYCTSQDVHMAFNTTTAGEPRCVRRAGRQGNAPGVRAHTPAVPHEERQATAGAAAVSARALTVRVLRSVKHFVVRNSLIMCMVSEQMMCLSCGAGQVVRQNIVVGIQKFAPLMYMCNLRAPY